jgi:regulatory subunit for Cdc7p protein kinase
MLTRLAPVAAPKDSLHTLLEDERIHGTRERDLNAPRPDYYYFKPGSKYLLIEDASNKHRTIMVKEYNFAPKDGAEWPILYEKFLRPSAANQSTIDPAKIRDRAWALYVEGVPFEGERPPRTELKRSTSLRALPTTPKLPEAMPYQNASGNSVVLTSNIASTSTAGNSPVMFGQNAMGMFKDRALSQMNKRVQVLKGNARLAAAKRSSTTEASIAELCSRRTTTANANSSTTATAGETSTSSKSTTSSAPSIPAKTFLSFTQLVGMLEQARLPVTDAGITAEMRIKNREKVENGLKGREQETAAGYCENCRVRYSDLSVVSREC